VSPLAVHGFQHTGAGLVGLLVATDDGQRGRWFSSHPLRDLRDAHRIVARPRLVHLHPAPACALLGIAAFRGALDDGAHRLGVLLPRPDRAHQGQVAFLGQPVERQLHLLGDGGVHLLLLGLGAEAFAEVQAGEHLHRDLRRQRHAQGQVEHRHAEGRAELDGQDLEAKEAVESEQLGQPLSPSQEERRLLAPDRHDRHDGHAEVERQADEAAAPAQLDLRRLGGRAVAVVVAARVDEQGRTGVEGSPRRFVGRGQRAVLAQEAATGHFERQVVGELVKGPFGPEVLVEGVAEGERVHDQRAARVVSHEQHRPLGRDVLETSDLGPEVDAGQGAECRQGGPDEVRVALGERIVGVGAGEVLSEDGGRCGCDPEGVKERAEDAHRTE